LEDRIAPSTLPAPTVTGQVDITGSGSTINHTSPSVAVDPVDSQKLVSVWTPNPATSLQAAYSNDGGKTWTTITAAAQLQIDPATAGTSVTARYQQVVGTSVGFDRNQNFYILSEQATGQGTNAVVDMTKSGGLFLQKFSFGGNTPVSVTL